MTLHQNCVRPITSLFEVGFRKYFTEMIPILRWCVAAQHLGCYLEGQGHSMTFQQNCVRPITLLFEVRFYNYFTWMITILRRRVECKFRLLHWRSRSQQYLTAKSCRALNFVIWSRIFQYFYINDDDHYHYIETTCRALHLGHFLKVTVTAWPFSIIVSGS